MCKCEVVEKVIVTNIYFIGNMLWETLFNTVRQYVFLLGYPRM